MYKTKLLDHAESLIRRKMQIIREKHVSEIQKVIFGKEFTYEEQTNFIESNLEHYLRFFGTRLTEADLAYK